jgi:hypothetical protein
MESRFGVGRNSGVSALITIDVKNTTKRDLKHQGDLRAKSLKMRIVVKVVSKVLIVLGQKGYAIVNLEIS